MSKLVFCLMGPTASGKTGLACELTTHFPMEIVSVDSAMIYKDMNIGTAKPTSDELMRYPHHLIDIKEPIEAYSAAEFCADAQELCTAIFARGKIPLLVGGTMMYFRSLQQGLSVLPSGDEVIRRNIEQEAAQCGWPQMHKKLTELDPLSATRINAHDAQRIGRALEVYYLTGSTLSSLQRQEKHKSDYSFVSIGLMPTRRAWLHERIAMRFDQMLEAGLVDEVQQLKKQWELTPAMPAMRCVGYRQVDDYLLGHCDYNQMREKGVVATRQLAKRQLTWLRHWDDTSVYDPEQEKCISDIIEEIKKQLYL